jgi:hypothetical protein
MKSITRNHNFTHRLNLVRKGRKFFYLNREQFQGFVKVPITKNGIQMFQNENWEYFEEKENQYDSPENVIFSI